MKIPERAEHEGLVEYAERLSELYASMHGTRERKSKGQFFTPPEISRYMAGMFEIKGDSFRLLDPGAGTGSLTAAFCERLLDGLEGVSLQIDAYENDTGLSGFLRRVLEVCKARLEERGHSVSYNVYEDDFIEAREVSLRQSATLWQPDADISYDFVIANPPYYKLGKNSSQSAAISGLICGQPNIYALFMALSAAALRPGGEMVFITPRSFCSGLYYKRFREWFLGQVQIQHIHTFESRKEIFDKDDVLQENVILKARKSKERKGGKITVTVSRNKDLNGLRKIEVEYGDIVATQNGEKFIRVPSSGSDVDILHVVDSWPVTLRDLGLEISTGPVVPFRATRYLLPNLLDSANSAPLLWMHNMRDMHVVWPGEKSTKPSAIRVCDESRRLLLPVRNYVLVKRFSSKEQRRRLDAAVLLESGFRHDLVGIENHVNYIHKPNGDLTVNEAFGIAAILNTRLVDNFFRSLNGNTQVNAIEMRCLPLPTIEQIREIGRLVRESRSSGSKVDFDNVVCGVLGISADTVKSLTGEYQHGQN